MTIRDRIEGKVFHRTCRYSKCKQEFDTAEPGQVYCSDDCKAKNAVLRRHRASYHRKNRDERNHKNTGRRELQKWIESLPEPERHTCDFGRHVVEVTLEGHHGDGDTDNNSDENRCKFCRQHHSVVHHPAAFNKEQVARTGKVVPVALYCNKARAYVVCTTLNCSGSKHCAGIPVEEYAKITSAPLVALKERTAEFV